MRVIVEPHMAALSVAAARFVAEILSTNPATVLALPTGRTPLGMYRELTRMYADGSIDFSRTRVFNLDEYLDLPQTDERSFNHYLHKNFLSLVNIPKVNIALLLSTADSDACEAHEHAIATVGGIDLLIAGVGTNGHIAFNEPGSALDSRTRIVELAVPTRTNMGAVFTSGPVPARAVTMGLGTILEARKILVLASGQSKRHALTGLLHWPVATANPVSALRLHDDVTVIVDQEAMRCA
jgi:glucosamine-6-phosphate deaminase